MGDEILPTNSMDGRSEIVADATPPDEAAHLRKAAGKTWVAENVGKGDNPFAKVLEAARELRAKFPMRRL